MDPQISIFNASATVDVWRASLARPAVEQQELARCLAPDEERRAARFRAQRDRIRFSAARGLLRHILARYVGVAPARIVFGYEALGKPLLPDHPEVSFNLSHSGDVLVVAITHGRRVGVDVEALISEPTMHEVLEVVSSDPERELLARLPATARPERFSGLWTRKEAYIKADGRGMSLELKRIDVLSHPNRVLARGDETFDWAPCPQWTVRDLSMGPGFAAAVVAEGESWRTACFEWPGDCR